MINVLEVIHTSGYVYNNLTLDSIMFDHGVNLNNLKSPADFESKQLNLIDFTYATPYIDIKTRKHLPGCFVRPERFPTDIKFSAFNQLHKARTSRKDDMMSLCYMLIYLMN